MKNMKVLVIYAEDDLCVKPQVYNISTSEKRSKAFLYLYRYLRDIEGAFCSIQDNSAKLDELIKRRNSLIAIMRKIDKKDKPIIRENLDSIHEDIAALQEEDFFHGIFDNETCDIIYKLFASAEQNSGIAAEKLLKIISAWSGDDDKIYSYKGLVWNIVNVKNGS